MADKILAVNAASKVYRMGEVDVPALRFATLEIFEGEFLIVVGPSGSGKSTLLNLIGGMDRPTSGNVTYYPEASGNGPPPGAGVDLSHASDQQLTLYRRNQVGFVFQFFNLIPSLTAVENVQVALELEPKLVSRQANHDRQALTSMDALGLVGLAERADHFPSQLSGGEQQRVAIARALAGNPRLLLCDEPTGALDSETGRQILQLLGRLNRDQGKTVVLITHNNAIAQIGHRVASIHDGKIASVTANQNPTPAERIEW